MIVFVLFRSNSAEIDSRARPFRLDHRCDRRGGIPAGAQLATVEDDERLAGAAGKIGAR